MSIALATVIGMSGIFANAARGQDTHSEVQAHRFWVELGLGYGYVERKASSLTLHDDTFALNFAGGWRVSPQFAVGLDLGGYNLQATCLQSCSPADMQKGKGIEHLFVVADYRAASHDGWLVHAGAGATGYWAQSVSQYYNSDNSYGWGAEFGTGYTWRVGAAAHLGVRAGYEFGHFSGNEGVGVPAFDFSALKVTVTFAYF